MEAAESRPLEEVPSARDPSRRTVAHLVSPYLFLTGSWIHSQITHNTAFRPIVITQGTQNLDLFPWPLVFDLSADRRGIERLSYLLRKYAAGTYPLAPYRRIVEREGVSLLHAHLGWEGARTVPLRRAPGLPFVVSFYGRDAGLLPRKLYWRTLYKRLFARADRVLAEGSHMGEVLRRIGVPAYKIRVVHLGIPVESFRFHARRPPADPEEPIVGLLAASFREKKGVAYALEAVARVGPHHPRLLLRIIGDGPLRPAIEERCRRPDLVGRVELLGYRPYPFYLEQLRAAHFLMAPSVTARDGDTEGGAPVCLLEAQASGLPVVATTHCDIPEVTRPGKSALLAPERDVDALAGLLEDLLAHPQRWAEMGREGREHIEAEYNIQTQVQRMNAVYQELLQA